MTTAQRTAARTCNYPRELSYSSRDLN